MSENGKTPMEGEKKQVTRCGGSDIRSKSIKNNVKTTLQENVS